MTLPQAYDPKEAEKRWQQQWQRSGVYAYLNDKPREATFVIDTPPPTVSGVLHMGHIFSYTQADFVARYQRMAGKDVFYPMGFDDNGLPTERLVEKAKKIRAVDVGREKFIEECLSVSEEARAEFRALFESVALSVDWKLEYHTISEEVRRLSQASFLDLVQKNHCYRDLKPFFWDPVDQTAIAQAEIEDKELASHFCDIVFGVEGIYDTITIGTTRPELLGACVAVFYHPEDERYQYLKGKTATTPLFGAHVPILEDDTVEPDKGTGIMMCCTFGDEKDIEKWRKHKLDTRVILNKYGKMDFCPENICHYGHSEIVDAITGKKVKEAREITIELLKKHNLLVKQEPITHAVKCAERSGAPLEILPTHQWFVRLMDKKDALKAKARECEWNPEFMRYRIEQWIDGLGSDWCISRQRYFGVPFPVWYSKRAGEEGEILYAAPDQLPVNPIVDLPKGYTREEVTPDMDVMDTWATSSISPQISAHSLSPNKLYPADIRPQAHEIIRTWAFYTIAKSCLHNGIIPWHRLMISGWCLAADKTKMSKSKGNVVTPVALIEEKGADAVRYWASTSRLGADTAFSEDLLKIGRKLVTKLWNASQLVARTAAVQKPAELVSLDKWILTRLHRAVTKATAEFEKLEYADARAAVEDFFWNDFCDNYLELVKARAYENDASAAYTMHTCLEALLRLFAPFIPHVTEEIYQHLYAKNNASVHARGMWPKAAEFLMDEAAEQAGFAALEVLEYIRKTKSEAGVSIKVPVTELQVSAGEGGPGIEALKLVMEDVRGAGSVEKVEYVSAADAKPSTQGWYKIALTLSAAQTPPAAQTN